MRQWVIGALLISVFLNFFFLQLYVGKYHFKQHKEEDSNSDIITDHSAEFPNCLCRCPFKKCIQCTSCPLDCPKCPGCDDQTKCQNCKTCPCPKLAKDPLPRSEVRQLDLLHALEDDLIESRKGKNYTTIHDWNPVSFVINLKHRADRRDSFFKMFDSHNIPPSLIPRPMIFEAVNTKNMSEDQLWKYNGDGKEWSSVWKGYELAGAYGCYLSHVGILKTMVEKYPGKDLVIFEDDAYFHPHGFVQKVTTSLQNLPSNWGMYFLGGALWSKPVEMADYGYKMVVRMGNTHSIMIRAAAIRKLWRHVSSMSMRIPIDVQYAEYMEALHTIGFSPHIPLAGQTTSVSDVWDGNNANIEQELKQNVDHFVKGKWAGGWWRRDDPNPCGLCEVDGVCGC